MKFVKDIKDYLHEEFESFLYSYEYKAPDELDKSRNKTILNWTKEIKNGMIPEKGDIIDSEETSLEIIPVTSVEYVYCDGKIIGIHIYCGDYMD